MGVWPVGIFGSGYGTQDLANFAGAFPIVKLILALVVLPLLMYTCRRKFPKNGPRVSTDTTYKDSRAKEELVPQKSTDTLVENVVKKRRRRKKKPITEYLEKQEQSSDTNKGREHGDTACTCKEVKVLNQENKARVHNADTASVIKEGNYAKTSNKNIASSSTNTGNQTREIKKRNKVDRRAACDVGFVTSGRDTKNSEITKLRGRVEEYKEVKIGNKGVIKPASEMAENPDPSRSVEEVKEVKNATGCSKRLITNAISLILDQHVVCRDKEQKNAAKSPRNVREVKDVPVDSLEKSENSGKAEKNETAPRQTFLVLKSKTEQLVNTTERKEIDCRGNDLPGYTETPVESFSSESQEIKQKKTNTETSANRQRCSGISRKSFDRNLEKHPKENDLHCANPNQTRPRSFRHSSETESRENERSAKYWHNQTNNRSRRKSFDRASESDPRGSEHPDHHRPPTHNRGRARSFDCSSQNDSSWSEHPKSHRRYPTDSRRTQGSFGRTPGNDPRGNENPENHRHYPTYDRRRRKSFHRNSENADPGGGEHPVNHGHCPTDQRTRRRSSDRNSEDELQAITEPERPNECEEAKTELSKEPLPVHVEAMNPKAETTSTEGTPARRQSQFVIDPEVRERIAHPKHPVRVPDKPFIHLSYQDGSQRSDDFIGPNKSFVNGLFGRKWREEMEKKKLQQEIEEDAEEKRRRNDFMDLRDNTCPTFMIWGVCHRGDHCPLRHPPGRYLERPSREVSSPERRALEEPKRDPNSYAAILEKRNSKEPKEFFNEALLYEAESKSEMNGRCYSKALVNARQNKDTSQVPVTNSTYEEAWPSLASPVQGSNNKAPKAWNTEHETPNVPHKWNTQKDPWILEENAKGAVDIMQISNDEIIANELQADEYAEMDEYDDYRYYPEEDFNEESYDDQEEDRNAENESSSDIHLETKVHELEQFNASYTSPVITEQSTENPTPPPVVSSLCDICMDRPKDATLVCGHRFCYVCALQMRLDERVCAICRRCIVSVIKTYN